MIGQKLKNKILKKERVQNNLLCKKNLHLAVTNNNDCIKYIVCQYVYFYETAGTLYKCIIEL